MKRRRPRQCCPGSDGVSSIYLIPVGKAEVEVRRKIPSPPVALKNVLLKRFKAEPASLKMPPEKTPTTVARFLLSVFLIP